MAFCIPVVRFGRFLRLNLCYEYGKCFKDSTDLKFYVGSQPPQFLKYFRAVLLLLDTDPCARKKSANDTMGSAGMGMHIAALTLINLRHTIFIIFFNYIALI